MRSDQSLPTSGKTRILAGNGRRFADPTTPYTEASREDARWHVVWAAGHAGDAKAPGVHKRRMSLCVRAAAKPCRERWLGP